MDQNAKNLIISLVLALILIIIVGLAAWNPFGSQMDEIAPRNPENPLEGLEGRIALPETSADFKRALLDIPPDTAPSPDKNEILEPEKALENLPEGTAPPVGQ